MASLLISSITAAEKALDDDSDTEAARTGWDGTDTDDEEDAEDEEEEDDTDGAGVGVSGVSDGF